MPFGVVSGVDDGMSVLDGVHIPKKKGSFEGFLHVGLNGFKCIFQTEMHS